MTALKAPVEYEPEFLVACGGAVFQMLSSELAWVRHGTVPRMEYYVNSKNVPYTYGSGDFARTYQPQPDHNVINIVRQAVELFTGHDFEVCFLNRYLNQSDHLGWHSDNSPEMDDARPICIVSFGVERDIMFRRWPSPPEEQMEMATPERLRLGHGSIAVMAPGMQDTHQHRIPKAGFQCGERISLTFRGYKA